MTDMRLRFTFGIAIFVLAAVGGVLHVQRSAAPDAQLAAAGAPERGAPDFQYIYRCAEERNIRVRVFGEEADLTLSDGRMFTLVQAPSPTGERFADAASAFSFWHDREHAYLEEGGKPAFTRCVENAELSGELPEQSVAHIEGLIGRIADGRSQKCEIAEGGEAGNAATLYVESERMRAEYEHEAEGLGTVRSDVISDGEWVYVWSSDAKEGMKMPLLALAEEAANARAAGELSEDIAAIEWRCEPWYPDEDMFKVPKAVAFSEITDVTAVLPLLLPL